MCVTQTYGECPVLSSAFAAAFVSGLQGNDSTYVAATAGCKHFDVHGRDCYCMRLCVYVRARACVYVCVCNQSR